MQSPDNRMITARFREPSPNSAQRVAFRPIILKQSRLRKLKSWVLGAVMWVCRVFSLLCRAVVRALRELAGRVAWRRRKLLLLDLDGTLVNCECGSQETEDSFRVQDKLYRVSKRPFLEEFLLYAGQHFDVAVFTASQQDYAEGVLGILNLSVPIYSRASCIRTPDGYIKDLRIFPDLTQVVLLDDSPFSFSRQPGNGIQISTWRSGNDEALLRCIEMLHRVLISDSVYSVDLNKW